MTLVVVIEVGEKTYQLEFTKLLQVNDGDGTGWSLHFGLGEGRDLQYRLAHTSS